MSKQTREALENCVAFITGQVSGPAQRDGVVKEAITALQSSADSDEEKTIEMLRNVAQPAPDRERIAKAICCPSGCGYLGDSEDGEKCYCDTTDFHGSGIEKKTDAVMAALPSAERGA